MKNSRIFIPLSLGLVLMFSWQYCGKSPSPLPLPYEGSIHITAMDTARIDSVQINLDLTDLGEMENPCLLEDVVIGFHRLHVFTEASAGTTIANLEVRKDEITRIFFTMETGPAVGPYVGNEAPQFATQDIQGNPISLQDHQGKVILLAFFEYT